MDHHHPPLAVELVRVAKAYDDAGGRREVLRDVTLRLPVGTAVALLGRSGSGKTTLLNLVAGLDAPDAGELRVAGTAIHDLGDRDRTLFRRRHLGFVYQFFNLIPTLSVEENVRLPLDLLGHRGARTAARAMLDRVGLVDRAGDFPDRLSGGEQQRVAIARALVADPPIVLADEPTGNLDADTGDRVLALLLELTRERGRTLLVATHSEAVAAAADLVLRVVDGRLEHGAPTLAAPPA